MKKFIVNILIFILLFIVTLMGFTFINIVFVKNQYLLNYQASILDKIERLKSINEPKIILVGNSNLAFGIDSEKIEQEIGMPVVNLGLHGALGNAFHEDMAKFNIEKGDIVIISHTDYDLDDISEFDLLWITLEHHKELYYLIKKEDYLSMAKAYPTYAIKSALLWIRKKGNKYEDNISSYSRNSFNKYGDVVVKPDSGAKSMHQLFYEGAITVPKISEKGVTRINEYNKYISEKGATLLIASYPIAYGEYTPDREKYVRFEKELRDKLDCEVISNFIDYFISYEYFYDTEYHLTKEGAEIRTKLLIEDIKSWKNASSNI